MGDRVTFAQVGEEGAFSKRAFVPPARQDYLPPLVVLQANLCMDLGVLAVSAEVTSGLNPSAAG